MTQPQVASRRRGVIPDSMATVATRHLCAGVYLDREFLDLVIRKVCTDPWHWVAPSYGFDLVPVVRHAWKERAYEAGQQVCLLIVLVVGWAWDAPAAITLGCLIGLGYLLPLVLRTAPGVLGTHAGAFAGRMLHGRDRRLDSELRERSRHFALAAGACLVLLLVPVIAAGSRKIPLLDVIRPAAGLLLVAAAIAAVFGAARQLELNRLHRAVSLRPARLTQRERVIDSQQFHPYAIYQKHNPDSTPAEVQLFPELPEAPPFFVGSGELLHRWLPPVVIPLLRSEPGPRAGRVYDSPPFEAHALVNHLRKSVKRLRDDPDPDMQLPGVQVADRIYVAEPAVTDDRSFLVPLSPVEIDAVIDGTCGVGSHFLQICVTLSGEVVTTVFLRVTIKGGSLILDFAATALTGTPAQYHLLDRFAESGTGAVVRAAARGIRDIPAEIGRSWRLAEVPLLLTRAARACTDQTLIPRRDAVIGAQLSIREEKSTPWREAQHDEPQILRDIKIIETCLLHATEDFLTDHKVEISQFSSRASTIINASVLNMGRMDINNSAIGPNAQTNNGPAPGNSNNGPTP